MQLWFNEEDRRPSSLQALPFKNRIVKVGDRREHSHSALQFPPVLWLHERHEDK